MRLRPLAIALLVGCLVATTALAAGGPRLEVPRAPVGGNPAHKLGDRPIDDYAYDHARGCRKRPMPGALALESWLAAHAGGVSWGIMRCEKLSKRNYSLHAEGRAVDWHLDARDPAQRRAATRLIRLLLAPDRAGNSHALARRMGIQEIIWNCRSWWAGSEELGTYSLCEGKGGKRAKVSPTLAHVDHIHIGLSRAGARKRTTFWRR